MNYSLYNEDCIDGAIKHLKNDSIDLIITDPPYGIKGDKLHQHYNREESYVLDGYIEVPIDEYPDFSLRWIEQAERVLRPGGSIYIVSGYTNLIHILNGLKNSSLEEVNHLIWKYNFGVYTKKKYISSHYHILYYKKPGGDRTFNQFVRFGREDLDESGKSKNYSDREDVWIINREYKKGQVKNKNQLPLELLKKIILYSSDEGDSVCDFFLGGFGTAKVALGLGRRAVGFEKSEIAFNHQIKKIDTIKFGGILENIAIPDEKSPINSSKRWEKAEIKKLMKRFDKLAANSVLKGKAIQLLSEEFGRGRFGILNMLKKNGR